MHPELRLYEDVLPNGGEAALPALPRMIFVVHGSLAVADRTLSDGEALSGEGAVLLHTRSPRPAAPRGPADTLHRRHGAAARLFGQKLGRVSQRGRQGEAESASVQNLCRYAADGHFINHIGL